jgi:hypothetical protein
LGYRPRVCSPTGSVVDVHAQACPDTAWCFEHDLRDPHDPHQPHDRIKGQWLNW